MIAAIKAEFRKLLTVRSTYVLMIIAFLLVTLFAFYADGIKSTATANADPAKLAGEVTNAVMAVSILAGLAGIMLMTHEYRYNTIMYTLTASNSRSKTLFAKIIVISIFALLFTAFFSVLSPLMTMLGVHLHGGQLVHQHLEYGSLVWRVLFYGWGVSMIALVLAALIRNQIAVIVAYFMIPSTIESLLGLLLKHNVVYLPFNALGQVLQHQIQGDPGSQTHIALSFGKAALVALTYIVATWVITWILFVRRDAN